MSIPMPKLSPLNQRIPSAEYGQRNACILAFVPTIFMAPLSTATFPWTKRPLESRPANSSPVLQSRSTCDHTPTNSTSTDESASEPGSRLSSVTLKAHGSSATLSLHLQQSMVQSAALPNGLQTRFAPRNLSSLLA